MSWILAVGGLVLLFVLVVLFYIRLPKFGGVPSGDRLKRIQQSPNYVNGAFKNLSPTPDFPEGETFWSIGWYFLTAKSVDIKPSKPIPSEKTDLHSLPLSENCFIWMGHSSYFIQVDGKRLLIDPVLSGAASPIKSTTRAFDGADVYKVNDIPALDYLILTHDHWDHLDYETVIQLKNRSKSVITGLGVGAHLERWGFDMNRVIEKDWWDFTDLGDGFEISHTPARHFSGRGFKRAQTLWCSFVLKTPNYKLFLGGDSGYEVHFEKIGREFGPFDLAILETGQYDSHWPLIHSLPEQWETIAGELKAKNWIPVHWGKFNLAKHPWYSPAEALFDKTGAVIPKIGKPISLEKPEQTEAWWK